MADIKFGYLIECYLHTQTFVNFQIMMKLEISYVELNVV